MIITIKEFSTQITQDLTLLRKSAPKFATKRNKAFFKGILRYARFEFRCTKPQSARSIAMFFVQNRMQKDDIAKFHSEKKKTSSIYKFIKKVNGKR